MKSIEKMKRIYFLLILLQLSLVAKSQMGQSPSSVSERFENSHSIEILNLSYMIMTSDAGDKIHTLGTKLVLSYSLNKWSLLGIEGGVNGAVNRIPIGSFAYTQDEKTYPDGIVSQKIVFFPILMNWSVKFGKRLMFRAGPTAGLMPLVAKSGFRPKAKNRSEYTNTQKRKPFVYGAGADFSIPIFKKSTLNFGYKYLRLTSFTLENNNNGNDAIWYNSPTTKMKLAGHQIFVGFIFNRSGIGY